MVPDKEWKQYIEKGKRKEMLCAPCYDQIKIWIDENKHRPRPRLPVHRPAGILGSEP